MAERNIEFGYMSIEDIVPFEHNPRKIRDRDLVQLKKSIDLFGFTNPILVQKKSNVIIAGHQRLKALKMAQAEKVPVIWIDFDDAMARAYNIADNRLAEESIWDLELYLELSKALEDAPEFAELYGTNELLDKDSIEFKEFTEEIASGVRWVKCDECGHEFPL